MRILYRKLKILSAKIHSSNYFEHHLSYTPVKVPPQFTQFFILANFFCHPDSNHLIIINYPRSPHYSNLFNQYTYHHPKYLHFKLSTQL